MLDFDPTFVVVVIGAACIAAIGIFAIIYPED